MRRLLRKADVEDLRPGFEVRGQSERCGFDGRGDCLQDGPGIAPFVELLKFQAFERHEVQQSLQWPLGEQPPGVAQLQRQGKQ